MDDSAYKEFDLALNAFEGAQEFNKISKIEEFAVLKILKSYALQDYLTVLETFPKLRKYQPNHIKFAQIYVDSLIGTGQTEKAVKFLQNAIKQEKDTAVTAYYKEKLSALQPQSARQVSSEKK